MIRSNIRKPFEVSVRQGKGLEVYTVGASNKDEARGVAMGKYGFKQSDIIEVN